MTYEIRFNMGFENFTSLAIPKIIEQKYSNKISKVSPWGSLVFPLRTDSFRNLNRNFVLSSFVNIAFNAHDLAMKILTPPAWFLADSFTFPVRGVSLQSNKIINVFIAKFFMKVRNE